MATTLRVFDRKPRIYLAGPITKPDPLANSHHAFHVANEIIALGAVPFVPQATITWHLVTPKPYEFWLEYDFEWIKACDGLYRIAGESAGADREIVFAHQIGVPVMYDMKSLQDFVKATKRSEVNP